MHSSKLMGLSLIHILRYNMLRSDINDAMLNVADGDTDIYDYVDCLLYTSRCV